jgi:signal transduction histidine kinase/CheY-like chemotaxis protein
MLRRIHNIPEHGLDGVVYGEVSATGQYSTDPNKNPDQFAGSVGVIRNITEKVVLGKQKARLEEQLHHSMKVEAVGQMTIGIIHDLNNIMNNCLCSAELIREKLAATADTQIKELIGTMIGSIDNGSALLRTLIDFSRKARTQSTVLNAHSLFSEVIHLLEFTLDSNITVTQEFRAENPYVAGDPGQLQNVLVNIALNARDVMSKGGNLLFSTENRFISDPLTLPARQKSAPGEYLIMSITDTGKGMDEATRNKLFEPFFSTKPSGDGTGLGLSNVLRVMKNHKGFVDVVTALGRGSTFRLYIPITVVGTSAPQAENLDGLLAVVPLYINARVLVIDNDAAVCEVLKLTLQNAGCRVTSIANPLYAIEAFSKRPSDFDIILIDMLMPQVNGLECFRRLKEIHPSVRAILVSGLNELVDDTRIVELGFVGSVTKPFNIRKLVNTVAQAVGKYRE